MGREKSLSWKCWKKNKHPKLFFHVTKYLPSIRKLMFTLSPNLAPEAAISRTSSAAQILPVFFLMGRRFHVLLSFFEVVEGVHDFKSFWSFKKSNQKTIRFKIVRCKNWGIHCQGALASYIFVFGLWQKKTGCLGASGCPVLIGGSRFIMCLLVGRIVTTTWADLRPVSCLMCSSFPGGRCPVAHLHVGT